MGGSRTGTPMPRREWESSSTSTFVPVTGLMIVATLELYLVRLYRPPPSRLRGAWRYWDWWLVEYSTSPNGETVWQRNFRGQYPEL